VLMDRYQIPLAPKAMTTTTIDLDRTRLKLCIEIMPETEATERMVIISICREQGMPMIQTINLSELTPIPLPLAQIIQAYANSELAAQEPSVAATPEPIAVTKRSLGSTTKQMALL
jgi:hypothetical protein